MIELVDVLRIVGIIATINAIWTLNLLAMVGLLGDITESPGGLERLEKSRRLILKGFIPSLFLAPMCGILVLMLK